MTEYATVRTGPRQSAAGVLLYRDKVKGTAVIQCGDRVITGEEIRKKEGGDG